MLPKRRSALVRSLPPRPFALTERDLELVWLTWRFRWLVRRQYQTLLAMPCANRVNARVGGLWDRAWLERVRVATPRGGSEIVYYAGPAAVDYLVERSGWARNDMVARLRGDSRISPAFVPHNLQCNDVIIALLKALRSGGATAISWQNAHSCFTPLSSERCVRPDGMVRFTCEAVPTVAFIELDRGTVGVPHLTRKFMSYGQYLHSGLFHEHYQVGSFRTLFFTPSARRTNQIRELAGGIGGLDLWVTETEVFLRDPDPTSPIWWSARGNVPRALFS